MKKILLITMLLCTPAMAQQNVIPADSPSANPQMNEELRRVNAQIGNLDIPTYPLSLSDATRIGGILPLSKGGTGADLSAITIDGVLYKSSATTMSVTTAGASGQVLTSNGPGVAPSWNPSGSQSNVLFSWTGFDGYTGSQVELSYTSASLVPAKGSASAGNSFFLTYNASDINYYILRSKFIKTAGVSTITINARTWVKTVDPSSNIYLKVSVGGQIGTASQAGTTTPTWATPGTINVSGLTNGTTYDILISEYQTNNNGTGYESYCSGVVLTGS